MGLLQILVRLQAVDQEWDEKARLYQSARQRLSDTSELEARRKAERQRSEELSMARARVRDSELELSSLRQKAQQTEATLYGGRIRVPKELEDLGRDLQVLQKRIAQLEDQVLLAMTEIDDLEAAAKRATDDLQVVERRWTEESASLTQQAEMLRPRLKELQASRGQLRGALGRAELALYDELRAKKGGVALSPMLNGVCQTCRVTIPSQKAKTAETGAGLVTCDGCGRILYQR